MIAAQPIPAVRWSASGNGRPVRKTAAIGSSSGVRLRRYSARRAVFSEVRVVAATRSASSLQRRMAAMVYGSGDGAANVVPGGPDGSRSFCAATSRRTSRRSGGGTRPGDRPARALPGAPMRAEEIERFFAARVSGRTPSRWRSTSAPRTGWSGPAHSASSTGTTARRCTTSRSARRMRGARATGRRRPGYARPRVRDARAASHRAVRLRVQRAGDPDVPALRVRLEGRARESIFRMAAGGTSWR